jgi:hypothetical protein
MEEGAGEGSPTFLLSPVVDSCLESHPRRRIEHRALRWSQRCYCEHTNHHSRIKSPRTAQHSFGACFRFNILLYF